jgi:hypothetical protein
MLSTAPREFLPLMQTQTVLLAPDARVFVFMMGAALLSTIFFGLTPALQATRPDVVHAARHGFAYDVGPSRLRNALIVAQVTASVLLLICAGVLVRGAARIGNEHLGMRTHDILAINVYDRLRPRVLAALATHPLVAGPVAAAIPVPLNGAAPVASFAPTGGNHLQAAFYRLSRRNTSNDWTLR